MGGGTNNVAFGVDCAFGNRITVGKDFGETRNSPKREWAARHNRQWLMVAHRTAGCHHQFLLPALASTYLVVYRLKIREFNVGEEDRKNDV